MACYECVYIARQELTVAQAEQLSGDLKNIVSSNNGEVKNQEYWGLRNLAYKIRKNRKGHYAMFHIDAPSDTIAELERNMRLNEDILRYLTIKIDNFPEGPSIMMQSKTDRTDRPRRNDRYDDHNSLDDQYDNISTDSSSKTSDGSVSEVAEN
ncbi:MAG: 30S ribosomal protein S6 [Rhodospirillaceae bacterium]|nr:30S ribosomal protein S6 [Rhodospirillaceae bacterium]|tara:strand:- start:2371 stop:2829 length:459 start_codon:yes stop_codon:yes gene_type:complete